jgi:4-hydroxybenzoate polyprenyltransferase
MAEPKTLTRAALDAMVEMRIHQWIKNILIFVPAAAAHSIFQPVIISRTFLAFFSFSVCASAGYLINDLLDLKSDRLHPSKRNRPFARGALSPRFGISLAVILFLTAVGFGNLVSPHYIFFLCGYLILTVAYSLLLKTLLLVDVFLLAFFYTFRIFLGGEAAGVPVSFWLAAFSTFFFFSLAMVKRFNELNILVDQPAGLALRRDYRKQDLGMLAMWGTASGCASAVVLALYINSEDIARLYHHPVFLWPLCLAVLFWLNRLWMLANRRELAYDPIVFAIRDPAAYVVAALSAIALWLAI